MAAGPLVLNHDLVILCEGEADRHLLQHLCGARPNMPAFDMPFPTAQLYGCTNFGRMLEALRGNQFAYQRAKGILIVADSATNPAATFANICGQIAAVGNLAIPTGLSQLAASPNQPTIAVTCLPNDSTPGCLESLLACAMTAKYGTSLDACVTSFLRCDGIVAHNWNPEKRDKAKYHSMVAAKHQDDPSRAATYTFRTPPVVDILDPCFDSLAQRLRDFSANVQ